jgi:hypothetical protein
MTQQIPEVLEYDGISFSLQPHPPLPKEHPRIIRSPLFEAWQVVSHEHGDLWWEQFKERARSDRALEAIQLAVERCEASSPRAAREIGHIVRGQGSWPRITTACHRRHQGFWTISQKRLYLSHLSFIEGSHVLDGQEPIHADWITGDFVGAYGEPVGRSLGAECMSRERLFEFQNGLLVGERELDVAAHRIEREKAFAKQLRQLQRRNQGARLAIWIAGAVVALILLLIVGVSLFG